MGEKKRGSLTKRSLKGIIEPTAYLSGRQASGLPATNSRALNDPGATAGQEINGWREEGKSLSNARPRKKSRGGGTPLEKEMKSPGTKRALFCSRGKREEQKGGPRATSKRE